MFPTVLTDLLVVTTQHTAYRGLIRSIAQHVIGCSLDGARSMSGRIRGLATRLEECTLASLIPI
jgi:hypothetical protein